MMAGNGKALAGLLAAITATWGGSASALTMKGHWEAFLDGPEKSISLIFPEYSENEFAILSISCNPARRTLMFAVRLDEDRRPRDPTVRLRVDGRVFPLSATVTFQRDYDERWHRDATIPYSAPAARALVSARTVGLEHGADLRTLPVDRWRTSHARWARACRLG